MIKLYYTFKAYALYMGRVCLLSRFSLIGERISQQAIAELIGDLRYLRFRLNPVPPVKDTREYEGGTVDRSNEFEFPVS
jgi:hypothetical protein